jgi:hypothetical protein
MGNRPYGAEGAIPPRNLSGTRDHDGFGTLECDAVTAVDCDRGGGRGTSVLTLSS